MSAEDRPRKAARWLLATLGIAVLLFVGTLVALQQTFRRLGVDAQARYLALKQPWLHAGTRDGDELECINAAMLSASPPSVDDLRAGKAVTPEALNESAAWVDRVLDCTERRALLQDPEHLVGWGKDEPVQQRSDVVFSAAVKVAAQRGATEENAERCVRLLRLAADLSQLGETWSLNPRETVLEALGPCLSVLAKVESRAERAKQVDEVGARFISNRRTVEEINAHWETRSLWRWIPPEQRRMPAPQSVEQQWWMEWDEARAVRRMHAFAVQLAEVADTPGPEREARSKALDDAGRTLLDDTRKPELERFLQEADVVHATLKWAAAVLRRESPTLPDGARLDGTTVELRLRALGSYRVPLPAE